MEYVLIIIGLAALAAALWSLISTRRTMLRLEAMIDSAVSGTFTEDTFDESLLSAVEAKLSHYLSASAVSARGVQEEKDNIKTLISDISHQTKTPVANVLLYAELLSEQELTPESREQVSELTAQAKKLQYLIDVLVKTSRLETGILVMNPEKGELYPMLEGAVSQLLPMAEEKGVALTLEPSHIEAVFDPKWTAEAVCNLLDNAIKYTPAGGSVRVDAAAYEMFCRINVTDTGIGISEEEQPKVFKRFYRSQRVSQEQGVGIGLYLARQIAEGQGGYIKVSSKEGKGSSFSIYLPRS